MKRWLACAWIVALCMGLLIYSCGEEKPAAQTCDTQPTAAVEEIPTQPEEVCIYLYDEDETNAQAWEGILNAYEEQTGVQIRLWSEGDGEPAIVIGTEPGEDCVDLSGTVAYAQLVSWDLAKRNGVGVCAMATELQGFGLLCDPWLLAGTYSVSEINGFAKLEEIVKALDAQGHTAFAAPEEKELARWLLTLPEDGFAFARLYVSHMAQFAAVPEEAGMQQLHQGEAVFCLGSTGDCVHAEEGETGILPVYLGRENEENQTLCAVGSRYLWIRGSVSEKERAAALAFLDYLVMPDEDGNVPLDALQRLSPFRQTTYAANALEQALRRDLAAGKACLIGEEPGEITQTTLDALRGFVEHPTEELWQALRHSG